MKLCHGLPGSLDFETLLWTLPDKEFCNLTRSTIPLLYYWSDPRDRLNFICDKLGVAADSEGALCFEYPVKSVGRNKPSFTDLMYISEKLALGIEAKSTEPRYEDLKTWIKKGSSSENRRNVIEHWLEIIQKLTRHNSASASVGNLVYQMIHRMASVCSVNAASHKLIYQIFAFEILAIDYEASLRELKSALDPHDMISMYVHEVHLKRTAFFEETNALIATKNNADRPFIVRDALLNKDLFQVCDDSDLKSI
jgi:hypothetical protein